METSEDGFLQAAPRCCLWFLLALVTGREHMPLVSAWVSKNDRTISAPKRRGFGLPCIRFPDAPRPPSKVFLPQAHSLSPLDQ